MSQRFDLIMRGAIAATPNGIAPADIGVAGGASPPSARWPGSAAAVFDAKGLPSCRGSSTPRCISASPGWSGRKTCETGTPRRGAGRGDGGLRDAQHRAHHHRRGRAGRQAGAGQGPGMHCDHAFYVGGDARERRASGRAGAAAGLLRGQGVHGRLHRQPAGAGRRGHRGGAAPWPPARRLPFRGRGPPGRAPAAGPRAATGPAIRRCATSRRRCASTERLLRMARAAGQAHPRAARHHRRGDRAPGRRTRTSPRVEADAAAPDPGGARGLSSG